MTEAYAASHIMNGNWGHLITGSFPTLLLALLFWFIKREFSHNRQAWVDHKKNVKDISNQISEIMIVTTEMRSDIESNSANIESIDISIESAQKEMSEIGHKVYKTQVDLASLKEKVYNGKIR